MTITDLTDPPTVTAPGRFARFMLPKKIVIALTSTGLIAASGGAAYAYWTSTGTGSASATAGTTVPVTITGTTAASIYPGGSFTVALKANNTNTSPVKIGTISATAATFDSNINACDTLINDATFADFSMADVVADQTLAASTNNIALPNGTLVYNNTSENQDACQGAVITVTLTATRAA
jgi:hypothetical protein